MRTVVVRRSLVPDEEMTGSASPIFLPDRTMRALPEITFCADTRNFSGRVFAKCVDDPQYDLVFGILQGAIGVESAKRQCGLNLGRKKTVRSAWRSQFLPKQE